MHSQKRTNRVRPLAGIAIAAVLLSGCAQTKDFFSGMSRSETPSGDPGILGAPQVDYYLDELRLLASGDPAAQAEIYADAQSGAQLTPGPQTNLRYALVLGTPGHPESDAAQSASMLREVLAAPELLTQAEISLASIALRSAEELAAVEAMKMKNSLRATENVTIAKILVAEGDSLEGLFIEVDLTDEVRRLKRSVPGWVDAAKAAIAVSAFATRRPWLSLGCNKSSVKPYCRR